ncbi:uncharacterized protein E5676_scaffold530G00240 [Cucumis melo var. makuwa]|uniref:Envelope-like protein n=1 Tax=Cucumis melo var. makuwa TaxID=1194695 RepID=A0A5A7VLZ1_CUCMM|nr:uncharacterized protein E6C27_scaffold50G00360 [Cucumis melo var. makuwa]TYK22429.1 uncharacterized protein E5676_scaffold530G00240 [Cucumis melo var. makuwa]
MVNTRNGTIKLVCPKKLMKLLILEATYMVFELGNVVSKALPLKDLIDYHRKKSQVNISESSPVFVHHKHIVDSAVEDVETSPGVSESYISEMDSDEQDDVLLARLLKNGLFSNVEPSVADVPITSAHSDESSSSEDVFVVISGHTSATNEEVSQSGRFSPVRSSVRFEFLADNQHSVPNPYPVGDSTDNLGENISNTDYQTVHISNISMFEVQNLSCIINGFLGNTVESNSTPSHPQMKS